jgi:putative DNA-invertase from lambdoid prophage Rac
MSLMSPIPSPATHHPSPVQDCILYGRVSTDHQDMSRQERMFTDYCARNRLRAGPILLDDDTSGSIPFQERKQAARLFPELQTMLRHGPVAVVTTEQDRIGRDTMDIIATIRAIWEAGGVPHFTAEGGALPRTPENELRMELRASIAQYERNKIRQRVQSKMTGKRAAGELCGTLPYGSNVRYTFTDGHELLLVHAALYQHELEREIATHGALKSQLIEPNPTEQSWLLQMLRWRRVQQFSYGRIARELNTRSIPTKTGAGQVQRVLVSQHQSDLRFTDGKWKPCTVQKLLNTKHALAFWEQQTQPQSQAA